MHLSAASLSTPVLHTARIELPPYGKNGWPRVAFYAPDLVRPVDSWSTSAAAGTYRCMARARSSAASQAASGPSRARTTAPGYSQQNADAQYCSLSIGVSGRTSRTPTRRGRTFRWNAMRRSLERSSRQEPPAGGGDRSRAFLPADSAEAAGWYWRKRMKNRSLRCGSRRCLRAGDGT